MRAREYLNESEYVLYKDGQPISKSSDEAEVLLDYNNIKTKFPNSSFEIKKIVCTPQTVKQLQEIAETIRKVKGGYRLVSHTGKNLGTYPSHAGAEKRERQVQYFKHVGEDAEDQSSVELVKKFIPWVAKELGLQDLPKIIFLDQPEDTTFGTYSPDEKTIKLVVGSRHPVDVMRTLAHELVHYKQDSEGRLSDGAGATGTDEENEANAEAGVVMRNYNQTNPDHLKQ